MSYDIYFKAKIQDCDYWVDVGYCDCINITWNVGPIIRKSTGLEWDNEENNGPVKDVIPKILDGIRELSIHPEKYKPLEPGNGWGTVEVTIRFFNKIIEAWHRLLEDDARTDSKEGKKLSDVVCFWIC